VTSVRNYVRRHSCSLHVCEVVTIATCIAQVYELTQKGMGVVLASYCLEGNYPINKQ
jgi:hypothetical protein